jgi:hypothetical protein
LVLIPGSNPDYYDITLTLSGTDMVAGDKPGVKRVNGFEKLTFANGIYKTVQKTGEKTSDDQ